ncbi:hypothetical protein PYCCODRAFT_1468509 [Trametes coccinea BRFM310]|uniref:Uncharacterized protein n=1 Tax=Trametes coccinea (strain BRFM310) TaxID=1353009 RepID=A0A1Y2IKH0_TRAC3|nr:hypothetical protein PYCCODRAFT_1468509 [Trametes coccinea BRFM310]
MSSLAHKITGKLSNESQDAASKPPEQALKEFIAEDPNSVYTFDSARDAPRSEICREGKEKGRKCIQMEMYSTQLFQAMQDQGFFCALPMDPTRTYIECKRIPKN